MGDSKKVVMRKVPVMEFNRKIEVGDLLLLRDFETLVRVTYTYSDSSGGEGYAFNINELGSKLDNWLSVKDDISEDKKIIFIDDEIFGVFDKNHVLNFH